MLRTFFVLLAILAALYACLCIVLVVFQRSLLYFPQPRGPGAGGELATLAVPGATLQVTTRPRDGPKAVLYFGGNAEDVSQSLPTLDAAFPDRALYLLHYRGYGGSTGAPTEAALFADALALHDHVRATHPELTVIGRSLGSGVAVHLASERPVQRLVLVTPYDSIVGIGQSQFPWVPVHWLMRDRFESWRYAPKVGAPTTLIVAEHDEVIPPASSLALHGRFTPGVATLAVMPGAGHNALSPEALYVTLLRGNP